MRHEGCSFGSCNNIIDKVRYMEYTKDAGRYTLYTHVIELIFNCFVKCVGREKRCQADFLPRLQIKENRAHKKFVLKHEDAVCILHPKAMQNI